MHSMPILLTRKLVEFDGLFGSPLDLTLICTTFYFFLSSSRLGLTWPSMQEAKKKKHLSIPLPPFPSTSI